MSRAVDVGSSKTIIPDAERAPESVDSVRTDLDRNLDRTIDYVCQRVFAQNGERKWTIARPIGLGREKLGEIDDTLGKFKASVESHRQQIGESEEELQAGLIDASELRDLKLLLERILRRESGVQSERQALQGQIEEDVEKVAQVKLAIRQLLPYTEEEVKQNSSIMKVIDQLVQAVVHEAVDLEIAGDRNGEAVDLSEVNVQEISQAIAEALKAESETKSLIAAFANFGDEIISKLDRRLDAEAKIGKGDEAFASIDFANEKVKLMHTFNRLANALIGTARRRFGKELEKALVVSDLEEKIKMNGQIFVDQVIEFLVNGAKTVADNNSYLMNLRTSAVDCDEALNTSDGVTFPPGADVASVSASDLSGGHVLINSDADATSLLKAFATALKDRLILSEIDGQRMEATAENVGVSGGLIIESIFDEDDLVPSNAPFLTGLNESLCRAEAAFLQVAVQEGDQSVNAKRLLVECLELKAKQMLTYISYFIDNKIGTRSSKNILTDDGKAFGQGLLDRVFVKLDGHIAAAGLDVDGDVMRRLLNVEAVLAIVLECVESTILDRDTIIMLMGGGKQAAVLVREEPDEPVDDEDTDGDVIPVVESASESGLGIHFFAEADDDFNAGFADESGQDFVAEETAQLATEWGDADIVESTDDRPPAKEQQAMSDLWMVPAAGLAAVEVLKDAAVAVGGKIGDLNRAEKMFVLLGAGFGLACWAIAPDSCGDRDAAVVSSVGEHADETDTPAPDSDDGGTETETEPEAQVRAMEVMPVTTEFFATSGAESIVALADSGDDAVIVWECKGSRVAEQEDGTDVTLFAVDPEDDIQFAADGSYDVRRQEEADFPRYTPTPTFEESCAMANDGWSVGTIDLDGESDAVPAAQ